MSLAYQYPGCPIVSELAQYALRVTRSYDIRHFAHTRKDLDTYQREKLIYAIDNFKWSELNKPPTTRTRLLFEELYGIPVSSQLVIEDQLRKLDKLEELRIPLVTDYAPPSWKHYWDNYAVETEGKEISFPLPIFELL